jgi:hypothetical protein
MNSMDFPIRSPGAQVYSYVRRSEHLQKIMRILIATILAFNETTYPEIRNLQTYLRSKSKNMAALEVNQLDRSLLTIRDLNAPLLARSHLKTLYEEKQEIENVDPSYFFLGSRFLESHVREMESGRSSLPNDKEDLDGYISGYISNIIYMNQESNLGLTEDMLAMLDRGFENITSVELGLMVDYLDARHFPYMAALDKLKSCILLMKHFVVTDREVFDTVLTNGRPQGRSSGTVLKDIPGVRDTIRGFLEGQPPRRGGRKTRAHRSCRGGRKSSTHRAFRMSEVK